MHWESGNYPEKVVKGHNSSSTVVSAWDDDRLIGLVRGLDDGETVAFLHYLLVRPEYQGMHIGQELMERILHKYENMLYVKIMPSDPSTIPFYEKFGFRSIGISPAFFKIGNQYVDCVLMYLDLR